MCQVGHQYVRMLVEVDTINYCLVALKTRGTYKFMTFHTLLVIHT